ncbi:MAG: hypothetical protein O7G85_05210 [Planctomycetota bacterium]|nr:hypothetical protein [Planctomycetota bacterium]
MVKICQIGMGCLCSLALSVCTHTSRGDIIIKLIDGTDATTAHATKILNESVGGWDIKLKSLYDPGGETTYEIYGTGGEDINEIDISVPCWKNAQGDCAPAGSPVTVFVRHGDALGIRSIGRIIQSGDASTSVRYVEATQDIGEIVAMDIGEVYAGRDVVGPIISTTENNSVYGVYIVLADRDVLGDVKAPNGRLGMVYASGTIGKPGAPVTIESRHIFYELHSETAIYAHVDTTVNGGTRGLWAFITPIFEGTIHAPQLPFNIYAGRAALVEISERFSGQFIIDRGFDDPAGYMKLPLGGLEGSIIFNQANDPSVLWNNNITFGQAGDPDSFTLSGPDYTQTSQQLGGGSVGLGPFKLHDESCFPTNGMALSSDEAGENMIARIRHYGPVVWNGDPISIERRDQGSSGPFTPLNLIDFGIQIDPSESNTLLVGKAAFGQGGFEPGFEYRILPTAFLKSDIDGLPLVQWDAPYSFTLENVKCAGDVDASNFVDVTDLLLLLAKWGSTGPQSAGADQDENGLIDVRDLLILLASWGPCH